MEYLKVADNGQWSLHKSVDITKPLSAQPVNSFATAPKVDKPYKVYGGKTLTGELHEDRGQKGSMRNFGGGDRPKNAYNKRTAGKPFKEEHSVTAERNPGLGEEEI